MSPVIMPSLLFGPWIAGIDETERRAGLRALAALIAVYCGSDNSAVSALRQAELDASKSDVALAEFDKLAALPRRKILATYARIMSPRPPRRATCP